MDCLIQTLSRRNENITVVWGKQCTIILVVYRELLAVRCFLNSISAIPAHTPLPRSNLVLPFEKRNHLCSLCWLINFRFTVLIPYHAHVGTYVIHFCISHGSSFWGPKAEKEFNSTERLAAFSGRTNGRFSEDHFTLCVLSFLWLFNRVQFPLIPPRDWIRAAETKTEGASKKRCRELLPLQSRRRRCLGAWPDVKMVNRAPTSDSFQNQTRGRLKLSKDSFCSGS